MGWRKYLDAICVFLWASTPVLIPFAVFTTTILVHGQIKPQQVFTTIALLNMLIYPMNAFPWIINGFIEATVSLNRIINILLNYDETSLVLDDYPMINDTMNDRQYNNENSSNLPSMTETGDIGGSCELKNEENKSSECLQINKLLFEQAG